MYKIESKNQEINSFTEQNQGNLDQQQTKGGFDRLIGGLGERQGGFDELETKGNLHERI